MTAMLNNIQALRAFAALNVVLFHILGASTVMGLSPGTLQFLEGWGECGVDIFFVISGFVMVVAHAGKNISPLKFIILRVHRIAPLYWILTLLLLAVYALTPQLAKSIAPSTGHILASLLFLSGVLIDNPPVVYVGWTLEYEMLFYLLFAASLLLPRGPLRLVLQIIGMAIAIGLGSANAVLSEFLLGVLAGELFLRQTLRAYAPSLLFVGIALLCVSIFVKTDWSRLIIWGVPSLMIVWGAADSHHIDNRFLSYLGAASYSIYLVQVISLPAFYKLAARTPRLVSNEVLAVSAMIVTTLAGYLLHQHVEKPIATWLKARRQCVSFQIR